MAEKQSGSKKGPKPIARTTIGGHIYATIEPKSNRIKQNVNCAVQIYKCVEGKFQMDFEAIKGIFQKASDKLVAVYCISGRLRSGKSFIMGLFLKYLINSERANWMDQPIPSSFRYSNSAKRVTTGIWIWSEPIFKKNSEGKDVAIFLMDTQGWFDDKTSMTDNALVFGLASLFSSVMIFNVDKRIGEDDLQYLQNFSFTAKLLDERNNDQPFQQLTFLIRDWLFTSKEEGFEYGYYDRENSINGKNFTTEQIHPQLHQFIDAQKIRDIICSTYEAISTYLLPFPGEVVELTEFNSSRTNKAFIENLKNLVSILFDKNNILPKKFAGNYLTGNSFIEFAKSWAKDFEIDSSPVEVFTDKKDSEEPYLLAYQTAIDYYDESMNRGINKTDDIEELKNIRDDQRTIFEESKAIFLVNQKLDREDIRNRYLKKMIGELEYRERHFKKQIDDKIKLKKLKEEEQFKAPIGVDMQELQYKIDLANAEYMSIRRKDRKNWLQRFVGTVTNFFA